MVSQKAYRAHRRQERYPGAKRALASQFKNIILGGQDGLVNVFGLALGVAAGTNSTKAVLIAGLAGAFAESISMAAVAYTSTRSAMHYYTSERARERREIKTMPEIERQEIQDIYFKKGFRGRLLSQIVKHITSKKKLWLDTMMSEELNMNKSGGEHPGRSAWIVGIAAIVGSLIPLVPFFFLAPAVAIPYVAVISTGVLFITGSIEAKLTIGTWWKRGVEMAVIGMLAASAGYLIGAWLGAVI